MPKMYTFRVLKVYSTSRTRRDGKAGEKMDQKKMSAEEFAVMVEDAAAKLSGEDKTDFLLKIVIILLVACWIASAVTTKELQHN